MIKKFNREFSTKEKILLLVLALIIIVAVYYYFVFQPAVSQISKLDAKAETLNEEIVEASAMMSEIELMRTEMDTIKEGTREYTYMPSYNYEKQEIDFLQNILSLQTKEYNISFSKITRDKNQLRRKFSLKFTASDYDAAEAIINQLEKSEIRCIIGDMSVSFDDSQEDIFEGEVGVTCSATFYETVYGGIEDSELPKANGNSR